MSILIKDEHPDDMPLGEGVTVADVRVAKASLDALGFSAFTLKHDSGVEVELSSHDLALDDGDRSKPRRLVPAAGIRVRVPQPKLVPKPPDA